MSRSRIVFVVALAMVASHAFGWWATGHMVVAAIAQRNLKPKVRLECDRLLKIGATSEAYDFITAGPWADDVRRKRPETAGWHFIDLHFRTDGKPTTMKPDPDNVVVEITRQAKILGDKTRPDADRADALRFLIHFVGDVHQPLHGVSRDSDEHPTGDRGGNDFRIAPPADAVPGSRPPANLHALWDSGVLLFPDYRRPLSRPDRAGIIAWADKIIGQRPRKSLKNVSVMDPMHWAQEDLALCKSFVYSFDEGKAPPAAYIQRGQQIVTDRIALAGYRLADLLNKTLGG